MRVGEVSETAQCDPVYETGFARWEAATRIGGDAIVSALTGSRSRPDPDAAARLKAADAEAERLEAAGFSRREPCGWEGPAKCAKREPRNSYRVVHYIPDPFLDGRMPVALLVSAGGAVKMARLPFAHGWTCLGAGAELIKIVLAQDLTGNFDRLPMSVGPHFVLGDVREIPAEFGDPFAWIERAFLGGERP